MKNFGAKTYIFPMPVFVIGTYDENGKADAMTAAWGGTFDTNQVFICLARDHKTSDNIILNKEFTIAYADKKHVTEADYLGIVSANEVEDKLTKAKVDYQKAENVNAPLLVDFPITAECKVSELRYDKDEATVYVVADIVNICAREEVLDEKGRIDMAKAEILTFDPSKAGYYLGVERVADAFSVGKNIK